ncbi:TIGR01212 family radical SAM protein [uncultured Ilyobacter sp.]|uniref:TIGR01212 family radical SAM protein n=1 Tax=uncultured Ilyobacter sp. TaxID=544433 RepID=UPI0029C861C0|nr:TIGR01212 family radical SAM protein [uncultured Ilyobacter sp.]
MWDNKRFHTVNYELKKIFGEKIYKVSLDGGFTCPNRDGTLGYKGCLFCSDKGSGEFAGDRRKGIGEQIEDQLLLIKNKFQKGKVIAYFQNFTNTYAPIDDLRAMYTEALSHPRVAGLAIATRPDCLPEDVLDLLEEISRDHFVWVELGLQTIHERSSELINRGYTLDKFIASSENLIKRKIPFVTHLILGLPGESKRDMLESAKFVDKAGSWGIKIHLLHLIKDTPLHEYYKGTPFKLMEKDEYISLIVDILEVLNPEIVIHRITGDGSRDTLIGPLWSLDKRSILNGVDKLLKERNTYQGKFYIEDELCK